MDLRLFLDIQSLAGVIVLTKKSPSACQLPKSCGAIYLSSPSYSSVPRFTMKLSPQELLSGLMRSSPPKRSFMAAQAWKLMRDHGYRYYKISLTLGAKSFTNSVWCRGMCTFSCVQVFLSLGSIPSLVHKLWVHSWIWSALKAFFIRIYLSMKLLFDAQPSYSSKSYPFCKKKSMSSSRSDSI